MIHVRLHFYLFVLLVVYVAHVRLCCDPSLPIVYVVHAVLFMEVLVCGTSVHMLLKSKKVMLRYICMN